MNGLEELRKMWLDRNLPGEIISITPVDTQIRIRGHEIKQWLDKNSVDKYIIIDDDKDMLEEQLSNFINVHPQYGITFKDAENAVKLLEDAE